MTADMFRTVTDAYLIAAARTPIGRAGGVLADIRPDDLAARAIRGLVDRAQLPVAHIDDVILGCANQAGEDNRNVARMALLLAGLPVEIPGQTVNRLCGSGLQAVVSAAHAIRAGEGELFLAGGVESMTRAPYIMLKTGKAWDRTPPAMADSTVGWRFTNPALPADWTIALGQTAERVAQSHGITPQGTGRLRGRKPAPGPGRAGRRSVRGRDPAGGGDEERQAAHGHHRRAASG